MPTESSAVSHLIRYVHVRPLQLEPRAESLFGSSRSRSWPVRPVTATYFVRTRPTARRWTGFSWIAANLVIAICAGLVVYAWPDGFGASPSSSALAPLTASPLAAPSIATEVAPSTPAPQPAKPAQPARGARHKQQRRHAHQRVAAQHEDTENPL